MPHLAFGSPRVLPKVKNLVGRVVVVDVAFAATVGSSISYDAVTLPFLTALGDRLAAWVDHHDHERHGDHRGDPRFVLATKAEHGACPEMITKEVVERAGKVDTIVCHGDFDGLASAAKWMRGGLEPYPGCDLDARAIDTRLGVPSALATRFDRAIRARSRDQALFGIIVRHLATGLSDPSLWEPIDAAGAQIAPLEERARRLAQRYEKLAGDVAIVDVSERDGSYDKTLLLMLGQERARAACVIDGDSATFAARFDSGINFLALFGISGGMPTVVSIQRSKLAAALAALAVPPGDIDRFAPRAD